MLPLAVHYGEYNNTILDWLKCYDHSFTDTSENPYQVHVSNIHQSHMYCGMLESRHVQLDGFEEVPLNEPVNASSVST